jgi:hypothetical protein
MDCINQGHELVQKADVHPQACIVLDLGTSFRLFGLRVRTGGIGYRAVVCFRLGSGQRFLCFFDGGLGSRMSDGRLKIHWLFIGAVTPAVGGMALEIIQFVIRSQFEYLMVFDFK